MNPMAILRARHNAVMAELNDISTRAKTETRELTPGEATRSRELLADLDAVEAEIARVSEESATQNMLAEARAAVTRSVQSDARVTAEARTYGPGSPHSYYADMIVLERGVGDPRFQSAVQRRSQWAAECETEIAHGTHFGSQAVRQLQGTVVRGMGLDPIQAHAIVREVRDRGRYAAHDKGSVGLESRAINSGGGPTVSAAGGAAAFITPVFGSPYIPYREYGRAFADQCAKGDLPDYGLAIYKPQVTGPAGVGNDTDTNIATNGVTEVDPTAGYEVAALTIFEGQVVITQAIIDRTAPDFRFDAMCEDQLHRDYDPKFDTYALTQALANATSQSWTGNSGVFDMVASTLPGSGGIYGQVSKAKASMRKLAGTILNPTHLFGDPSLYEYMAAWADSQGRPLVVPNYAGPMNAAGAGGDGDANIEGFTGTRFNGLPFFTDANIPTTNGTLAYYQLLVCCCPEIEVYESAPVNRVLPQTKASNLQVILQRYSYATVFVNYTGAVTKINGTGFSALSYTG